MELYDNNGYLNFAFLKANEQPFNIIIGGRGIGKTYGKCLDIYEHGEGGSLLIRTTQKQADFICSNENTPFKSPLDDINALYCVKKLNMYMGGVYKGEIEDDIIKPVKLICRTAALSTFHNMRGFDGSSIREIMYDEFNEEDKSTRKRGTGNSFFNLYETVNRNRELKGEDPVKVWLFGNSNDIFNDILVELQLISKICDMMRTGKEISIMKDRGIALYGLQKSPISSKKKNTALYKATAAGSDFQNMALDNIFKGIDYRNVKKLPLNQLKPVAKCGEIVLYKEKNKQRDYISLHVSGTPAELTQAEFIDKYDRLAFETAFERGILFDSPEAKVLLKRLFT